MTKRLPSGCCSEGFCTLDLGDELNCHPDQLYHGEDDEADAGREECEDPEESGKDLPAFAPGGAEEAREADHSQNGGEGHLCHP